MEDLLRTKFERKASSVFNHYSRPNFIIISGQQQTEVVIDIKSSQECLRYKFMLIKYKRPLASTDQRLIYEFELLENFVLFSSFSP